MESTETSGANEVNMEAGAAPRFEPMEGSR